MDYTAVGQTTHLAARMEQMAMPGSILLTQAALRLAEGYVQVTPLGPVPVKGLAAPVDVFELVGASGSGGASRRRRPEGSRALSAATPSWRPWSRPWSGRELATGRWSRWSGRPGWASPASSMSVSTLPHAGLAGAGEHVRVLREGHAVLPRARPAPAVCPARRADAPRTIRAKVTGQILTLDEALQDALPPCCPCWTRCRTTARS